MICDHGKRRTVCKECKAMRAPEAPITMHALTGSLVGADMGAGVSVDTSQQLPVVAIVEPTAIPMVGAGIPVTSRHFPLAVPQIPALGGGAALISTGAALGLCLPLGLYMSRYMINRE